MDNESYIVKFFTENFQTQISPEKAIDIEGHFLKKEFKSRETIFLSGTPGTGHYFIEQGLVRMFIIDKNGREFNIEFAKENQIIGDLSSPDPTRFNLEAIEPTIAYSITEKSILSLIDKIGFQGKVDFSDMMKRSYIKVQQRLVNALKNSAEENYIEFRETYPDLIQRLPQYHIAAYLGISAEFLSKTIAKALKKA